MAMIGYSPNLPLQDAQIGSAKQAYATHVWQEAAAWLALLPTLFITVSGYIETSETPIAFRFTAMEDDSPAQKFVRLGCSILMLYLISTRLRATLSICKKSGLLLLLPALACVSALWSQSPYHTLVNALNLLLTTLFAIFLYLRYPGNRLVSFLTFAAFISLVLCVLSVTVPPRIGIDPYHQNAWRAIFGQRNNCAIVCTLFLAVGLHASVRGIVEQFIRTSVVFLSLVFIVMSASRTGWILAALALVLTFGLRFIVRIRSLDRIVVLMVIAIPTILIGLFVVNNFTQVLAALDKDPTMTQRTIIWAQVLPSIAKHPILGYGYLSFWRGLNGESMQAVLVTRWMEYQAQDGYLDVLLELGLVGLIPLIALFLRAFAQAVVTVERKLLTSAAALAIVLLPLNLIGNIGESTLLFPLGMPWFYCLIAFLILGFHSRSTEAC